MLFQVYGDGALWQFCGWLMVFVGLVLANEIARRSKAGGDFLLPGVASHSFGLFYYDLCLCRPGAKLGFAQPNLCAYEQLVPLC